MSEISNLINVTFVDETSYAPDAGFDIIGCPFEHCWGPVNSLQVLNLNTFLEKYPEGQPIGASLSASVAYLHAWAQLRRALKAGAGNVECLRVQGNWKYTQWNLTFAATFALTASEAAEQFSALETNLACIATKFPGRPPKVGALADCVSLKLSVTVGTATSDPIKVQLIALDAADAETILETHYGSFDTTAVVDGQSFFIANVLERDSNYLAIQVNAIPVAPVADATVSAEMPVFAFPVAVASADYVLAIQDKYSDPEVSLSTIMLAPLNGDADINEALATIATDKKTCIFVTGFPLVTALSKANVESYITASLPAATFDMFSVFIAGKEIFKVCGKTIYLDCTAGWAGRCAQVAQQFRINQLPSAKAYGSFDGILASTLKFDDVLALHEKGVISVYTSNEGARIFGIRSRHPRQMSYFAKANISRVVTRLLKSVFPEVMSVIHTEVVSDATERAKFASKMNRIIDEFASAGNIRNESNVDVSNAINSDIQTAGGEKLHINFNIWFKKLVEKVNIKIIATDSSVTTTIN